MARPELVLLGRFSRPDEVAEPFLLGIRHPHRRQVAGPVAPGELERIPAVAGLHGHERWSGHVAVHPHGPAVASKPVVGGGAGFVADPQPVGRSQLANQPADSNGSIGGRAEAADLVGGFDNRERDGGSVDIESDES